MTTRIRNYGQTKTVDAERSRVRRGAVLLSMLVTCATGWASDDGPKVVPDAERAMAAKNHMDGPAKNQGVKSVTALGATELGNDFAELKSRQLRARELVIEPGGVVAVHQHDQRPGVAYILEGEIIEHRNDQPEPIVRKQGDTAFEKSGVVHWWENKSTQPVRALVVDIVPVETK